MIEPRIDLEVHMGKYGKWVLFEQRDSTAWYAKRADGVLATILFYPGKEPGFDPQTTPSPATT